MSLSAAHSLQPGAAAARLEDRSGNGSGARRRRRAGLASASAIVGVLVLVLVAATSSLLVGCAARGPQLPVSALRTTAEQTDYVATGDHAEALRLCRDLPRVFPGKARCDDIGRSAQGRPLVALVVSPDGVLTPEQVRQRQRPVLLWQAGIHAGEIEGKDAGFALLRDWLQGQVAGAASSAVTVVFVPIINPDGHERRTPNNRPNQRGPREMGFRTNGRNLNLNRDYAKADSSEIRAILQLMNRWDPAVFVDLHTTDGAKFEHDVAVMVSPQAPRADLLDEAAHRLSDALQQRLTALGHLPLPFYPSFVTDGEPSSGFVHGDAPPRFSTPYAAERGRLGILVETHSWRTYKERASSTYHTLQALLELAATEAASWRATEVQLDAELTRLGGTAVTLLWAPGKTARTIDFRGYHYDKVPSEISGAPWLRFDERKPEIWKVPLVEELTPALTITAPARGYIIHGGFAGPLREVLDAHGIAYRELDGNPLVAVSVFRVTGKTEFEPSYEGRARPRLSGTWTPEPRTLDTGSIFVPMAQPRARLILHLFEPTAPDSFAAWGHFNSALEQKEYMEPYVAEEEARKMLEQDPKLRAAFEAALAADPELAKSPTRRLDFFYRRHPSWDERLNLLPVFRLEQPAVLVEGGVPRDAQAVK